MLWFNDIRFSEPQGQGWRQISQLVLAVGLSAAVGIERQLRHKSAGLRTNTLVGLGSALFMLMSKYGFTDVLERRIIVLDPSRIAAQIVSGIGFVGGAVIFKQQSEVRGLTTAAAVWLTAAIGSACGAGLPILAAVSTGLYFLTVLGFPFIWDLIEKIRKRDGVEDAMIVVRYQNQSLGLEPVLDAVLKSGFETLNVTKLEEIPMPVHGSPMSPAMDRVSTRQQSGPGSSPLPPPMIAQVPRVFDVQLMVAGGGSVNELVSVLSQRPCVMAVTVVSDKDEL